MKHLTLIILFMLIVFIGKAQSPYHFEQNQNMHVTPLDENSYVYKWSDSIGVKHSKKFYIGQKFIEKEDRERILWTIYEICEQGVWYSCRENNGDGYMAYEMFIDNPNIKLLEPKLQKPKAIKHFKRLSDGSFYLKELKPGEIATFTIPIHIPVKHTNQKSI